MFMHALILTLQGMSEYPYPPSPKPLYTSYLMPKPQSCTKPLKLKTQNPTKPDLNTHNFWSLSMRQALKLLNKKT